MISPELATVAAERTDPAGIWSAWSWEPGIVIGLLMLAAIYGAGVRRLWRAAPRRGLRPGNVLAFWSGWLALTIALVSPLHQLSESLFSAHMVQHELMMVVAAPLLVLGHPFIAAVWALPPTGRGAAGRIVRSAPMRRIRDTLTYPPLAWSLHAVALSVWHAPALFQRTLTSEAAHTAQHLSFLLTALLFWWVIVDHRRRLGPGAAVLYLFGTALYTGGLGALLTFAGRPWYPAYAPYTAVWGLSPLEDQQLGGLIMWIPAGASYLVAMLVILARWLRSENGSAPAPAFLRPTTDP